MRPPKMTFDVDVFNGTCTEREPVPSLRELQDYRIETYAANAHETAAVRAEQRRTLELAVDRVLLAYRDGAGLAAYRRLTAGDIDRDCIRQYSIALAGECLGTNPISVQGRCRALLSWRSWFPWTAAAADRRHVRAVIAAEFDYPITRPELDRLTDAFALAVIRSKPSEIQTHWAAARWWRGSRCD